MTVIKDNNGTYSVRCWYRNWKGERKQKTKRGFAKLKDAKQWERNFLAEEHNEVILMDNLIASYKEYLDTQQKIGKLQETTVITKKQFIARYISQYFKGAPVANITSSIVNEWLAYLSMNFGYKNRMSSGTIKITRNLLSQIFDYGIKNFNVQSNPVKQSDLPAPYTSDERVKAWDVETFNRFYADLTKESVKVLFLTLYWSGLRIGECLALTPADISDNQLTIVKSWAYISKDKSYAKEPKNNPSKRVVVVPEFVCEALRHYISTIDGIKPTDKIFTAQSSSYGHVLSYHIEKLGLPKASLHTMRHSFASNILATSKDYVAAAALLGHKNANTTFKTYAHPINDSIEKSVEKLKDLYKN